MSRRVSATLIDGLTAQDAAGALNDADLAAVSEIGIHIEFDHTSAAGQVLIETASDSAYAGTWAILATVNWSAIDKSHYVALTGVYRAIRARIASAVTSGTVTVKLVGNVT